MRVFADVAAFVRTDGVEVAQEGDGPCRVSMSSVAEDGLDHDFGFAVRTTWHAKRHGFGVFARPALLAIHGRRRAEDEVFHARRLHGFDEGDAAADVVVVVGKRFLYAFADGFQAGKVDNGADGVFAEDLVKQCAVADVAFDKTRVFAS